jgi:hypothetical protein
MVEKYFSYLTERIWQNQAQAHRSSYSKPWQKAENSAMQSVIDVHTSFYMYISLQLPFFLASCIQRFCCFCRLLSQAQSSFCRFLSSISNKVFGGSLPNLLAFGRFARIA